MKKHYAKCMMAAAAAIIFSSFATSCKKEKPDMPEENLQASITIGEPVVTTDSATFEITTENALYFEFSVAKTGETAEFRKVESEKRQTVKIGDLEEGTSYTITAIAYNRNDEPSETATKEFTTLKNEPVPAPSITITDVKINGTEVSFRLVPQNATWYEYKVDVPEGTAEMTKVESTEATTQTASGLQSDRTYTITAVAYGPDGKASEPATSEFSTPAAEPFMKIEAKATAHGIYIKTETDSKEYPMYFLKIFNPEEEQTSEDYSERFKVDSKEQFIHYLECGYLDSDIKTSPMNDWIKTHLPNTSEKLLIYAAPVSRTEGKIVCSDYGRIIETVLEVPQRDEIGQGTAAVTLGEPEISGKNLKIRLAQEGNAVSYYLDMVTANELAGYGGDLAGYVQENLDNGRYDMYIYPISYLEESFEYNNLAMDTEYTVFTFAYGSDGKIGSLQSKTFKTENGVAYNPDYSVEINLKSASFTSVTFSVKRTNISTAKYECTDLATFNSVYGGSTENFVKAKLLTGYPRELYSDNDIRVSSLSYNTEYVLIALPEGKTEGEYGYPVKVEFSTTAYSADGTASVEVTDIKVGADYGILYYVSARVTPQEGCAGFHYALVDKGTYEINRDNIAEYVCKRPYLDRHESGEPVTIRVNMDTDSYLVIIPYDSGMKTSKAWVSSLIEKKITE